jgi:iron complex outermembrane receptor protein
MLSVLLGASLENNKQNNGGVNIEMPSPGSYQYTWQQPIGGGTSHSRQYWAQVDWDLGPATLTYLPAYRTYESEFNIPATGSMVSILQTGAVPDDNFVTHELRLASKEGSALIWQIGSLYYKNSLSSTTQVQLFVPVQGLALRAEIPNKTTHAVGVFGEATYTFAPSWRMTAGLRYDDTKVEVSEIYTPPFNAPDQTPQSIGGEAGTRKFKNTTYKARIEHDLIDQNLLYASVTTGFTPGDVTLTTGATFNPIVLDIKDQTLTAYEIGSKNRFLNDSLQINADVYYYDYGGFQQANVNFTPNSPTPSSGLVSIPVQSYGAEFEAMYQLTAKDRLSLNLAYTKAYFVDKSATRYSDGSGGYVTASDFFALDALPNTVPFTGNLTYSHIESLPGGSTLRFQADGRYVSPYESGPVSPTQLAQGAYSYIRVGGEWIGNLNATWASSNSNYAVTGYVRNVADTRYPTSVSALSQGGVTSYRPTFNDPRTYGVVLNVRF